MVAADHEAADVRLFLRIGALLVGVLIRRALLFRRLCILGPPDFQKLPYGSCLRLLFQKWDKFI